jgi:outer membrane protein assembly factor BamB
MSQPLLCPHCQQLLLQLTPSRVSGQCSACGWHGLPQVQIAAPHTPFSPQKGLLQRGLNRLWLAAAGQLLSFSPAQGEWQSLPLPGAGSLKGLAFAKGIVLLSPREENTLGEPKPFIGINSETGQVLWQVESEGIQWTAPVADESLACAVDSRGQVAVVHPHTGQPRWKRLISLGNFPRLEISTALSASYVLLTMPSGELIWLSRSNGKEAGRYLSPAGGLDFAPACMEDVAYLCAGEGLARLDLRNGESREIFRAPRKASKGYFFTSPQITPHGLLVLHADFAETGQPAYALQLLDLETGQALWKLTLQRHPYFAPAVDGDLVALPDRNGHILLLDLASGKLLHPLDLKGEKPASAPLFLNGELFLLTEAGNVLRFSPDLRMEHLPETPQEYLVRGEWESAALKHALQGNLNEAANLYKAHKQYPEARALYELAGNTHERDLLNLHSLDFRLTLRPHEDAELQENLYALLEVEIENTGIGNAADVKLLLASDQMDITQSKYHFGELQARAKKIWNTLQIRPHADGGLLLKMILTYSDELGNPHELSFEQGLTVLKSKQPAARVINIKIEGNVSDSVIVAGDNNSINQHDD